MNPFGWRCTHSCFQRNVSKPLKSRSRKSSRLSIFRGAVLALCCGPGRHSIVLAKRGLTVTSVDRTPFLLEKAKQRAKTENVNVEWILSDMRNFIRPNAYELALNMFTSFGYFDRKEDDILVLDNIYNSLKPGGLFLIDVVGKEWLAKVFQPTTSQQLSDGTILVQRHEIFDDWSRIRNEWILIQDGKAKSFQFHHTIYSGQELKDRLIRVGFQSVKLFGDLDGNEYGPEAKRLIAVASKESTKLM